MDLTLTQMYCGSVGSVGSVRWPPTRRSVGWWDLVGWWPIVRHACGCARAAGSRLWITALAGHPPLTPFPPKPLPQVPRPLLRPAACSPRTAAHLATHQGSPPCAKAAHLPMHQGRSLTALDVLPLTSYPVSYPTSQGHPRAPLPHSEVSPHVHPPTFRPLSQPPCPPRLLRSTALGCRVSPGPARGGPSTWLHAGTLRARQGQSDFRFMGFGVARGHAAHGSARWAGPGGREGCGGWVAGG